MAKPKRYYWLKLKEDFFNNREIKKLRKIAGGDTYTLIYLKLMLLSLKNDGGLIFEGTEENLVEQVSLEIDEDSDNVQVTLNFLFANNLICETENADKYNLPYAMECLGGESESAERVRRLRARQVKLKEPNNKLEGQTLLCNDDVTDCNKNVTTEIEIRDRDKSKREEGVPSSLVLSSSIPIPVPTPPPPTPPTPPAPSPPDSQSAPPKERLDYSVFFTAWNETCKSFPALLRLSDRRKAAIKRKVEEFGQEQVLQAFRMIEESDFLKSWKGCNFDWVLDGDHLLRILEGKYARKMKFPSPPRGRSSGEHLTGTEPSELGLEVWEV